MMKKLFKKLCTSSSGFTNIAALIALSLLLLPAAKLAISNSPLNNSTKNTTSKVADFNPNPPPSEILIGTFPDFKCTGKEIPGQWTNTKTGETRYCYPQSPESGRCLSGNYNGATVECVTSACGHDCSACTPISRKACAESIAGCFWHSPDSRGDFRCEKDSAPGSAYAKGEECTDSPHSAPSQHSFCDASETCEDGACVNTIANSPNENPAPGKGSEESSNINLNVNFTIIVTSYNVPYESVALYYLFKSGPSSFSSNPIKSGSVTYPDRTVDTYLYNKNITLSAADLDYIDGVAASILGENNEVLKTEQLVYNFPDLKNGETITHTFNITLGKPTENANPPSTPNTGNGGGGNGSNGISRTNPPPVLTPCNGTSPKQACGGQDTVPEAACAGNNWNYTPGNNNTANAWCGSKTSQDYCYTCVSEDTPITPPPGETAPIANETKPTPDTQPGHSSANTICSGALGGVDTTKGSNGYEQPICVKGTPTEATYSTGIFNAEKARAGAFKSADYYDVFACKNGHDFANKTAGTCDTYPWTQDTAGSTPTPKAGQPTCSGDTPYWDGNKCTVHPNACSDYGPHRIHNICQATECGINTPDTNAGWNEANTACALTTVVNKYCCSVPNAPTATPRPAGGTCSNNVKDGIETDVDCGGSCGTCINGKQCNQNADCRSNTCTNGLCVAASSGGGSAATCPAGQPGKPGGKRQTERCYAASDCECGYTCTGSDPRYQYCRAATANTPGSACGPAPDFQCVDAGGANLLPDESCATLGSSYSYYPVATAQDSCKSANKDYCCQKSGAVVPTGVTSNNQECSGVCYGGCPGSLQCLPDNISSTGFACKGGASQCGPFPTRPSGATATPTRTIPTTAPIQRASTCRPETVGNGAACSSSAGPSGGCSGSWEYKDVGDSYCQGLSNGAQNSYCWVCYSSSSQSTGTAVNTCSSNIECVRGKTGNACVFYGKSTIGICKTVQ